jgi:glucoamylase
MNSLEQWIERQYLLAARAMLQSLSPVHLVKERPGFGQRIQAKKGAVVASPILAAYDPDPDYFFHWYRDSAIVIDALRLLHADGTLGDEALTYFAEFVQFSLALNALDGGTLVASSAWRSRVSADFEQFVRTDEDLAGAHAGAILSETRVNPDGTLDISKWGRPQNDGPPLRALTLLRWLQSVSLPPAVRTCASELLRIDLAFTRNHWRDHCYDIWEEEKGQHYYTLCVCAGALEAGATWHERHDEAALADSSRLHAKAIRELLHGYWLETSGYYRSRLLDLGRSSTKELDIAVILAAVHAPTDATTHSVRDPKMHATLDALDALFVTDYPINQSRPAHRGPAMGRYAGDVYYSGGAYYFSSLGAAEFCYRAAIGSGAAASWVARGDGYLETVRAYTPADGQLSEQFDRRTGEQTSAKHLAWSYAALICSIVARRACINKINHDA